MQYAGCQRGGRGEAAAKMRDVRGVHEVGEVYKEMGEGYKT